MLEGLRFLRGLGGRTSGDDGGPASSRGTHQERLLREHRDALLGMEIERRSLLDALRQAERERAALAEALARRVEGVVGTGPRATGPAEGSPLNAEPVGAARAGTAEFPPEPLPADLPEEHQEEHPEDRAQDEAQPDQVARQEHTEPPAWTPPAAPVRMLIEETASAVAGPGEAFVLNRDELLLGRAVECDIRIGDGYVSRRHARVRCTPEAVEIDDLNSINGIVVNGRRVRRAVLADGDVVEIGVHRFRLVERLVEGLSERADPPATAVR